MKKSKKTVAIIQARMGSSRLPGKVLLDIGGKPMLEWVVTRTRRAVSLDEVVVATTAHSDDDPVAAFCDLRGYPYFRGSLYDVLDRYYQTAQSYQADIVVRITADCPLIDPALIDHTVQTFFEANADFAANRLPPPWGRTYPIGLDIEICTFAALAAAHEEAVTPYHREHVMPFLYENSDRFKIVLVNYKENLGDLRWTVDTEEDLRLVREVVAHFQNRDDFSWEDILNLFERVPDLAAINAKVRHKMVGETDKRAEN